MKKIDWKNWKKIFLEGTVMIIFIFVFFLVFLLSSIANKEKNKDEARIKKLNHPPLVQNLFIDFETEVFSCRSIDSSIYIVTIKRTLKKTRDVDYINVISLRDFKKGEKVEVSQITFIKNIYGYQEKISLIF